MYCQDAGGIHKTCANSAASKRPIHSAAVECAPVARREAAAVAKTPTESATRAAQAKAEAEWDPSDSNSTGPPDQGRSTSREGDIR